ncbi:MAG: GH36-type glycosyl hydrolase domain-containing protein [Planctomycetota bacterium]|jgi:cellobiose phosphorylase
MADWSFSKDNREFVIHTPYTPRPWINYLTNGRYQTGGGFSFYLDPSHHVITRREQDMLLNDRPGRFIFIQDLQDNTVWNVGGNPCLTPLEQYTCRHGFGYTEIRSRHRDVVAGVEFFVPLEADAEVWRMHVENAGTEPRELRVLAYQEWLLGNGLVDPVARRFDSFFKYARVEQGVVVAKKLVWGLRGGRANRPWEHEAFLTATRPPEQIWLDKQEFIGSYRDISKPVALEDPNGTPGHGDEVWGTDLIAAPQWQLNLGPGETATWQVLIGIAPAGSAVGEAKALADPARLGELRESVKAHWSERVTRTSVKTPDRAFDQLNNGWTPYQLIIKSYLSSAPSYYHASDGSPGFRDAMQDAFGLCLLEPARARELILRLTGFQFSDGSASHRAPRIPLPPERSEKSDLPLWIPLATLQYVRETGDRSIILEEVPYADGPKAPLLEHIRAGLERSLQDVGRHGLPLIHYGDWNDALDGLGGEGKGESVFLGQFLAFALNSAADLARAVGENSLGRTWLQRSDELAQIINRDCWDQDRFVRAFHDDGTVIGSRDNRQGRLYLNPQVWAVLAGLAPKERLETCMNTVRRELDTPYGIRCLSPPYSQYDPHVGLISCFPPGVKENGGIFSHAMAFCLVAELMLGRAEHAWEIMQKANPVTRAKNHPDYGVEPYVYSQFVAGGETNLQGQGFHHWLTGTCSWMQYAVINWMLGARAELDALVLDPCIPAHWQRYELVRPYREGTVHVTVENPHGKNKGIKSLRIDGREIEGNRVSIPQQRKIEIHAVIQ